MTISGEDVARMQNVCSGDLKRSGAIAQMMSYNVISQLREGDKFLQGNSSW